VAHISDEQPEGPRNFPAMAAPARAGSQARRPQRRYARADPAIREQVKVARVVSTHDRDLLDARGRLRGDDRNDPRSAAGRARPEPRAGRSHRVPMLYQGRSRRGAHGGCRAGRAPDWRRLRSPRCRRAQRRLAPAERSPTRDHATRFQSAIDPAPAFSPAAENRPCC